MPDPFATYPSLAGRAVFISGGASGIGESLVTHFAAQGARIGFVDLLEKEAGNLIDGIAKAGHPAPLFHRCDLRDVAALRAAIAAFAAELGPITVLVNNAANDQRHSIEEVTPEAEADLMQNQCLKEKIDPADVARLALWLAAEDSRMCTAQNWVVDAGWSR